MSLPAPLRVVGLLAAGSLLLLGLIAMGPIGWLVFGPMLVLGLVQAYRNQAQRASDRGEPNYCPNCGAAVDTGRFDDQEGGDADGASDADEPEWAVRYCPDCGAPLEAVADDRSDREDDATGTDRRARPVNCPDCGAPNDPDRSTCTHCETALEKT